MSDLRGKVRNLERKLERRDKKISELEAQIHRDILRFIEDLNFRESVSSAMKDMVIRFKDPRFDKQFILEVLALLSVEWSKEPKT